MSGSMVTCPACNRDFPIGIEMHDVVVEGAAVNVAVTCPRCHTGFDAAPGKRVRIDTVRGRLTSVVLGARLLLTEAAQDPIARDQLIEALRHESRDATQDRIAAVIQERTGGSFAGTTEWLRENQWFAQWLGAGASIAALFLTLLQLLGVGDEPAPSTPSATTTVVVQVPAIPSDSQIEDAIERVRQERKAYRKSTRRVGRSPERNSLCPCGQGIKYKKCCGASQ